MDPQEDSVQDAPLTRLCGKQYLGVAVYDTADTVYQATALLLMGESGAEQARRILFDGNRNYPRDAYL
jgi:hypothetical protein